jgi:hypothetical protein
MRLGSEDRRLGSQSIGHPASHHSGQSWGEFDRVDRVAVGFASRLQHRSGLVQRHRSLRSRHGVPPRPCGELHGEEPGPVRRRLSARREASGSRSGATAPIAAIRESGFAVTIPRAKAALPRGIRAPMKPCSTSSTKATPWPTRPTSWRSAPRARSPVVGANPCRISHRTGKPATTSSPFSTWA